MTPKKRSKADQSGRNKTAPFVQLHWHVMDSASYRACDCYARALLMELLRYWRPHKNDIAMSDREAAERLGVAENTARKAKRQLLELGLIAVEREAAFEWKAGARHGEATRYRLTMHPDPERSRPPSADYLTAEIKARAESLIMSKGKRRAHEVSRTGARGDAVGAHENLESGARDEPKRQTQTDSTGAPRDGQSYMPCASGLPDDAGDRVTLFPARRPNVATVAEVEALIRAGMSQAEVAALGGYAHASYVRTIQQGRRQPSAAAVEAWRAELRKRGLRWAS